MAAGLVAVPERAHDGGPLLANEDDERIAHVALGVGIVLGYSSVHQPGTLYITTKRLIWLSDEDYHKGYAVDFLSLSLHAISRDPDAYPLPCIYTQIESSGDEDWDDEGEMGDSVENVNHVDQNLSRVSEMRLIPGDPSDLDHLFQVLCDCALLNPDPVGEQEGEGEWYFNVNEVLGQPTGEEENSIPDISELHLQDPRFEDAEEELHEEESSNLSCSRVYF